MDAATLTAVLAAAGMDDRVVRTRSLSGGCIAEVAHVETSNGRSLVAKRGGTIQAFEAEADGLRRLAATDTVLVPAPVHVGVAEGAPFLLMTALPQEPATDESWSRFGADLAALHDAEAGVRYGLAIDNHLGGTPQPNRWCDDWVEFNRVHRLGHQVRLARDRRLLRGADAAAIDALIDGLHAHLPPRPRPALLHGDLWSGNAIGSLDQHGTPRVGVIDPAVSIGDGLADIAMMKLFGGFPPACFRAYDELRPAADRRDQRIAVYQLYHLLNHLNLFGEGYLGQVMSTVQRLAAAR